MKLLLALIYSLLSLITSGHQNRYEAIPGPLNDYRNRSFDPATGRFLQRDPVLDEHNLYNPYVGMGNNPVGNVDPMGTYMVARNGAAVAYVRRKMRSIGLKLEVAQVKGGYLLDVLTPNGYDREKIARARGKTWWGTSTRRILDRILDNNNNWTISGSGSMASADPSVLLAAVKGAAEGAVTGGKAVVNATASTVVGTVTCGAVDRVELIKYTQRDLDNGARLSEGLARAGTEILAGVATGSIVAKAGNLSKIGKVVRVMDLAQSGGDIVVGSADIAINGANVGNVMRVVGGVAGGTGELVGSLRGSRAAKNADVVDDVDNAIHRIGGGNVDNLKMKPRELTETPPGISVLQGGTAQEAADQMRAAFPNATRLKKQAEVVGSSTAERIRKAGYDVVPTPTKKFPNHHTLTHPKGIDAYNENLEKLSDAFTDTTGH